MSPSTSPSAEPSKSAAPSNTPSIQPSVQVTSPSSSPSAEPSKSAAPSSTPSIQPSIQVTTPAPSASPAAEAWFINDLSNLCNNNGLGDYIVYSETALTFGADNTINGGNAGSHTALAGDANPSIAEGYKAKLNDGGVNEHLFYEEVKAAFLKGSSLTGGESTDTDLGDTTFTPGFYSSVGQTFNVIAYKHVTLDGKADPDSVFIFQTPTTLITGAGCNIILKNGAKAENVLWIVGTTFTSGANNVFQGSILAGAAINYGADNTVHGGAFAKTAITIGADNELDCSCILANTAVNIGARVSISDTCASDPVTSTQATSSPTSAPTVTPFVIPPTAPLPECDVDDALDNDVCTLKGDVDLAFAVHAGSAITFNGKETRVVGHIGGNTGVTGDYELAPDNTSSLQSKAPTLTFLAHSQAQWTRLMAIDFTKKITPEMGGVTFKAGTYKSNAAALNIAVDTFVTLDAENDPDAQFLFQATSSLTTGANTYFVLKNGAKAKNVIWALGSTATLGADSFLEGSIVAKTGISFLTRAELRGCALAHTAVSFASAGAVNVRRTPSGSGACVVSGSTSIDACENYAVHARTLISFDGSESTITKGDAGISPDLIGSIDITGTYKFERSEDEDTGGLTKFRRDSSFNQAEKISMRNDGTWVEIEIGGETFTPGTYRSHSELNLAVGTDVTLDGKGDPNAQFLFQATSTLKTGAGCNILLKNGARAENVIWATGTAAILGANAVIEGSILAQTSITVGIGAEIRGCAIAEAAVTFESNGKIGLP
jgi:hypothetical protein